MTVSNFTPSTSNVKHITPNRLFIQGLADEGLAFFQELADLAGKAVVFKVKVHEVKEKEVPALDDEFAKDVSEFDTLKDLKADLKKKITEERQKDADRAFDKALSERAGAEELTNDAHDGQDNGIAKPLEDGDDALLNDSKPGYAEA